MHDFNPRKGAQLKKTILDSKDYLIIVGFFLSVFYWVFDSFFHSFWSGNTFIEELFHPTREILFIRSFVVFIFIAFSAYSRYIITEIRRIEEEKNHLLKAIASSTEGITIADEKDRYLYVNAAYAGIFGYAQEDFVRETWRKITPSEIIPQTEKGLEGTLKNKEIGIFKGEVPGFKKDGGIIPTEVVATGIWDEKGNYTGHICTVRDITEKKQAENDLKESEKKFRTIFEGTDVGIALFDWNGRFIANNPALQKILGFRSQELNHELISELTHPEDLKADLEYYNEMMAGKRDGYQIEKRYIRKDGIIIWGLLTVSLVKGDDNPRFVICMLKDITERKNAEGIRLENERLMYSNKATNEFLAHMSHELRTPLTSIIGFSQLLKRRINGELNAKQELYVDNVIESGKILLNLINDILDLSKIEAQKLELFIEHISVNEVMEETFAILKEQAVNRNIRMVLNIEPGLDFIKADRQRLKQVLFNLLSNALKFSEEEGGIVIVSVMKSGNMAQFSVSDTGIGIKVEDLGKLFRKFEQLDSGYTRKSKGTGLGLAISKQLVELHGGKITVESKYGHGSIFTFTIPIEPITVKSPENWD
ncbi:Methanogenesis regulatory histidine kinase FilI [uncultured archaeon]|nr:Methanogenesis regulatory histidine kinase FilI [uncultured archaeon]